MRSTWAILAAAVAIYASVALGEVRYTVTGLGQGYAWDINNSGQVVGYSITPDHWGQAFLYTSGTMTYLSSDSRAWGINDLGQVVGESGGHPFLYSNGIMMSTLSGGSLGCAYSINNAGSIVGTAVVDGSLYACLYSDGQADCLWPSVNTVNAVSINNSGQVVGSSVTPTRAMFRENGATTDLGSLFDGAWSYAWGINDAGQIVGTMEPSIAFLCSNGTVTGLGTLGGTYSEAYCINNEGQVVGDSDTVPGVNSTRAFIYGDGKMTDLNSLIDPASGWTLVQATAINDSGQIVGYGSMGAFLLTPVPEPATLSLLALAGMAMVRRRK